MRAAQVMLFLALAAPPATNVNLAVYPVRVLSLDYPVVALAAQQEGKVALRVMISKDGAVTSTEALSGEPALKTGAEKNIRQWAFVAREDRIIEVTYVFRLFDPKQTFPRSWNLFDFENATIYVSAFRLQPEASSRTNK